MKASIAAALLTNAKEHVDGSYEARKTGEIDCEVRHSIGAQLSAAIALEGVANDVGAFGYGKWVWDRIEKADTPLKWHLISGLGKEAAFDPGQEPLQSVQRLHAKRNQLAHPKTLNLGEEIIVRDEKGAVRRQVAGSEAAQGGWTVFLGFGELLDEHGFNADAAFEAVTAATSAVKALRQHLEIQGLEWIDGVKLTKPSVE